MKEEEVKQEEAKEESPVEQPNEQEEEKTEAPSDGNTPVVNREPVYKRYAVGE